MSKNRRLARPKKKRPPADRLPQESRASEAVTIAWTVSVTGVLIADLLVAAAHLYVRSNPEVAMARAFEGIMLLTASLMGAMSLGLLVIVWRTRRLRPPQGYVVFALLVAVAPLGALVGRLMR